uniref:Uncharacterized protein n=1 Tax=Panagrolaimus davidi TaxID=227884 RepID=A0A914PMQ0_9BILA
MIPEDEMKTSLPVASSSSSSSSSVPESAASTKNSELPSKGSSPLRPHRYRRPSSVDYYRVDQAPNVELLSSNSF